MKWLETPLMKYGLFHHYITSWGLGQIACARRWGYSWCCLVDGVRWYFLSPPSGTLRLSEACCCCPSANPGSMQPPMACSQTDWGVWGLILILEINVSLLLNYKQDAVLEADTEFWISICCEFNIHSQFQSMMKIIHYLTELPENKEGNCKTEQQKYMNLPLLL